VQHEIEADARERLLERHAALGRRGGAAGGGRLHPGVELRLRALGRLVDDDALEQYMTARMQEVEASGGDIELF